MREDVLISLPEAVAEVEAGATVGIGGVLNSCHPAAIVRELIRHGAGDLHIVGLASGIEVELLIAAGLVRKLTTPTVSAESIAPVTPLYRAAAQAGEIEVTECDEGMIYAALQAAAQGVPFAPWPVGPGTSFPEVNDNMELIEAPFGGREVMAIAALPLDFAFTHVAAGDRYGNVQPKGSGLGDRALARAAKRVIYSVDRVITNHEVRTDPGATAIAGVDAIVHAPFGAHPFSSPGEYVVDRAWIGAWLSASRIAAEDGQRGPMADFIESWVRGPATHWDYLDSLGAARLHGLCEGLHTGPPQAEGERR